MKAKVEVKRNVKMNRMKSYSVITLMILAFASSNMMAAAVVEEKDFKLWRTSDNSALTHLTDSKAKADAIAMIEKPEYEKFVTKFAKEPFQWIEALKEVAAKKAKDLKEDPEQTDESRIHELEVFTNNLMSDLKKVGESHFGGVDRRDLLLEIGATAMKEHTKKNLLTKLLSNDYAKLTFELTSEKKVTPPGTEVPPTPPVVTPGPVVGEQIDDILKKVLQPICDQNKELKKALQTKSTDSNIKQIEELEAKLRAEAKADADKKQQEFEGKLAEIAALQAQGQTPPQTPKREKSVDELLAPLIAQLAPKEDRNNDNGQAAQQQQPLSDSRRERDEDRAANDFNPELPQNTQPQSNPIPFVPSPASAVVAGPIKLNLPQKTGQAELASAQKTLGEALGRPSYDAMVGMNNRPEVFAGIKTGLNKMKRALVAERGSATDKIAALEEDMERLKKPESMLSPAVRQAQEAYKAAVASKKSALENAKQSASLLAPELRGDMTPTLQGLQSELTAAETTLNNYNSQVQLALEQADPEVQAMAKRKDALASVVKEIDKQLGDINEDAARAQKDENNATAMAMAPQQTGTPNINRLSGARTPVGRGVMGGLMGKGTGTQLGRGPLAGQTAATAK